MRLSVRLAAFLRRRRVAHLATADAGGRPHVVPICYALAGDRIYSVIDLKPKRAAPQRLRRVRNVLQNPRVAVVADVYSEDWSRLGFVLLEGQARLIEGGPEHARALRLLRRKYAQYRRMDLHDRPVIAITVRRAVRWGRF
ncbi:MAG: TIGR03668 family PPOX class F420-dependent oxidoreductase [Armatimonadetes bacterium]|nr:TIGR03668 family PPOX class F420-dependent oxidoreductase [Armatimonadota bacterium]